MLHGWNVLWVFVECADPLGRRDLALRCLRVCWRGRRSPGPWLDSRSGPALGPQLWDGGKPFPAPSSCWAMARGGTGRALSGL